MKMSFKWIQEFVDISDYFKNPENLAQILTAAGIEVEAIEDKSKNFHFVVTGVILEKGPHPQADKLSLCKVMTKEGVVHQIVCGAKNHQTNDHVVVALPGAILPNNFQINRSTIRGVESAGMLCSEKELGIAQESEGIMILPSSTPIGIPFAQWMGWDDITFELKVTPNRADCLSHFGLARELSCLLDRPLKEIKKRTDLFQEKSIDPNRSVPSISIHLEDPELCPRYMGTIIRGVKVGPSPNWLRQRLELVGLRSINNVVDITNYVMLEYGQPLHAFDLNEIKDGKIIISKSQNGEMFETLDGSVIRLTGDELMIKDGLKSLALAGVMGGKNSGVQDLTSDIFLEAAYFLPHSIRKSSRSHGLLTDSAYRFSRGVDPHLIPLGIGKACELLHEIAGAPIISESYDVYPNPIAKKEIQIHLQTISDRLGYEAQVSKFESFMTRLSCEFMSLDPLVYKVYPPTYRFDLELDMDIVEEYARINGYDQIPESIPAFSHPPSSMDENYITSKKTQEILTAQGFSQCLNMVFDSDKDQLEFLGNILNLEKTGLPISSQPIRLQNPLSEDHNSLRMSLVKGLFDVMVKNYNQGNESGRLFEIGNVFSLSESTRHPLSPASSSDVTVKNSNTYQEYPRLALIGWGSELSLWNKETVHLIFSVKSVIETLLESLDIHEFTWVSTSDRGEVPTFLHRGQFATLWIKGQAIGFLGSLHPLFLDKMKLRCPSVVLAEFNFERISNAVRYGQFKTSYQSFSRFPKISRDLSLIISKKFKASEILLEMENKGGADLQTVQIFDIYQDENLPPGQHSLTFNFEFQNSNGTMQDSVVQKIMDGILETVREKFSAIIR